jgi:amino acid transporter
MATFRHSYTVEATADTIDKRDIESNGNCEAEQDAAFEKGQATLLHDSNLHRGLKSRHITMIAIAGSIGTGLVIGTGSSLANYGPLPMLLAYSIVGFVVYLVLCALGEMAAWLPLAAGFVGYATRFVDPALGFGFGYTYVSSLITTPKATVIN